MRASFATIATPAGRGLVSWTARGVIALEAFVTRDAAGEPKSATARIRFLESVLEIAGEPASEAPLPSDLRSRIEASWDDTSRAPVDLRAFDALRRDVYRAVMAIPYGTVASYADVAGEIGKPRAWRAVGSALRRCPVDFLIPCHRVVHAGGRISGPTAASIEWKRAMLRREGVALRD